MQEQKDKYEFCKTFILNKNKWFSVNDQINFLKNTFLPFLEKTKYSIDKELHDGLLELIRCSELYTTNPLLHNRLRKLFDKFRPLDINKINTLVKNPLKKLKPSTFNLQETPIIEILSNHKDGNDHTLGADIKRTLVDIYTIDSNKKQVNILKEIYYHKHQELLEGYSSAGLRKFFKQNLNQEYLTGLAAFPLTEMFKHAQEYPEAYEKIMEDCPQLTYKTDIIILANNEAIINIHFMQKNKNDGSFLFDGNIKIKTTDKNLVGQEDITKIDLELLDCAYTQNNIEEEFNRYRKEMEPSNAYTQATQLLSQDIHTLAKTIDDENIQSAHADIKNLQRHTQKSYMLAKKVYTFLHTLGNLFKEAATALSKAVPLFGG